ncbi:hypothetical protein [Spirosoma aerophilum]
MKEKSTSPLKILSLTAGLAIAFAIFLFVMNKRAESSQLLTTSQNEKPKSEQVVRPSVNGVYSYTDDSAELEITVSDNHWSGKTIMKSGFGEAYDEQNAMRDNGVVKEGYLYDDSGMVKIGSVSDGYLHTSVGQKPVTLRRI